MFSMDLGLKGKSAFIAGASSGLGLAVATALVREGCNVTLCSRNEARIQKAADAILQYDWADPARVSLRL